MSNQKNPTKRCRVCGAKVKSINRFCKRCWEARKRGVVREEGDGR